MPDKNDITILAPSKEPQDLSHLFPGYVIHNPVQIIDLHKHEEMHFAFCKAIKEIKTPFFTIYDNDDPLPVIPETFPDVGIIFGNNIVIENNKEMVYPFTGWTFEAHKKSPQLIHRAICRTKDAQEILSKVETDAIYTEWWLYCHLAHLHGYHYDPEIKMYWEKHVDGLHTRSGKVLVNTFTKFKIMYR